MLACPSAAHVAGPTMPSAVSPWRRWKPLTARCVAGPKTPSTVIPSRRWSRRTRPRLVAPPELLRRGRAPRVRGAPQRGPGGGADDAVGGQPVAALEGLDGALGARPEDPVGMDAEPALRLAHARPLRALLERLRRRVGGGRGERRGRRDAPAVASSEREREDGPFSRAAEIRKIRSFLRVASVVRLRGELTGSRCLRYATERRRFAPATLVGPLRFPRSPPHGADAIRRPSFYHRNLLRLQDFLHAGVRPKLMRTYVREADSRPGRSAPTGRCRPQRLRDRPPARDPAHHRPRLAQAALRAEASGASSRCPLCGSAPRGSCSRPTPTPSCSGSISATATSRRWHARTACGSSSTRSTRGSSTRPRHCPPMLPDNRVGRVVAEEGRMIVLWAYSSHLTCLFPQHGGQEARAADRARALAAGARRCRALGVPSRVHPLGRLRLRQSDRPLRVPQLRLREPLAGHPGSLRGDVQRRPTPASVRRSDCRLYRRETWPSGRPRRLKA